VYYTSLKILTDLARFLKAICILNLKAADSQAEGVPKLPADIQTGFRKLLVTV
jgi:hypothetical protein